MVQVHAALRGQKAPAAGAAAEKSKMEPVPPAAAEKPVLPADAAAEAHATKDRRRSNPKEDGLDPGDQKTLDVTKLLGVADGNGDGKLSSDEMAKAIEAGLSRTLPAHKQSVHQKWGELVAEYNQHRARLKKYHPSEAAQAEADASAAPPGTIPEEGYRQAVYESHPFTRHMTPEESKQHAAFIEDQINVFGEMDENHDGHLSREEFIAHHTFLSNGKKAFQDADTDGDGNLTLGEMTQMQELIGENDPILQHLLASAHDEEL